MKNQLTGRKESAMASLLREVLGDVLRRARTEQGRTLRQVSDAARVSLGYLSAVERGRKEASSELLSAICDALDVSLSQLLADAGGQLALLARSHPATRPTSTRAPRCSARRSSRWPYRPPPSRQARVWQTA